jgi:hypothetical protein
MTAHHRIIRTMRARRFVKDGEQGAEVKPATQGNTHKPAKDMEKTARLVGSVQPNKDPEKVRLAGERSEQL